MSLTCVLHFSTLHPFKGLTWNIGNFCKVQWSTLRLVMRTLCSIQRQISRDTLDMGTLLDFNALCIGCWVVLICIINIYRDMLCLQRTVAAGFGIYETEDNTNRTAYMQINTLLLFHISFMTWYVPL